MSAEDLENYESEAQLALYEEYKKVSELFRYVVETDRRFYLANEVVVTPRPHQAGIYCEVNMTDVWVWDIFRASRFVKHVQVYTYKDLNVEERNNTTDFVVPELPNFPEH